MQPLPHYRVPPVTQPPSGPHSLTNSSSNLSTPVNPIHFHELLEALRQEYEQATSPNGDGELKLQSLFNEFVLMQKMVRELEANYAKVKRRMEEQQQITSDQAPSVDFDVQPTFTNILGSQHRVITTPTPAHTEEWNITRGGGNDLLLSPRNAFKMESVVCGAAFSADGKHLALAVNRSCLVINLETYKQSVFTDFFDAEASVDLYMRSVCFSPDEKLISAAGEDHYVRVWSMDSGKVRHRLAGHSQDIYAIKFSSDGTKLFSASGDRTVRMWDVMSWECVRTFTVPLPPSPAGDSGFTGLALSPSGKYFATASMDRTVRVWEIESGEIKATFEGHSDAVYCVDFSPVDDSLLVSGSLDRSVRLWKFVPDGTSSCCLKAISTGHCDFVLSVVFTPDGRYIISGGKDRNINFWSVSTFEQVLALSVQNSVICLAATDGMFVCGSGDNKARLWTLLNK